MHRFDTLTRVLGKARPRRAALPVLGGLLAAPLLGALPGEAKKKNKKVTLCFNGSTIKASKKKKKKLLKQGATPGACQAPPTPPPDCVPNCPGNTCGVDDGCGGICGCAATSFCDGGTCQECDVTDVAGLTAAFASGGSFVVCPGRYDGNFALHGGSLTLIGAGDGNDPATNTILDANNSGRVVTITSGTANFQKLRITRGRDAAGAGIGNNGDLTLTGCTVTENEAPGGEQGGGINNLNKATLNGCTISNNKAASGGGIRNFENAATMNLNDCSLDGNQASGNGGGFLNNDGTISFSGGSITNNTAGAGGIGANFGGTVNISPETTIIGNNPSVCDGC